MRTVKAKNTSKPVDDDLGNFNHQGLYNAVENHRASANTQALGTKT